MTSSVIGLKEWITISHNQDYVDFAKNGTIFQQLKDVGDILASAHFIFETYLKEGAPESIGINPKLRKKIQIRMANNINQNIFDEILTIVRIQIKEDLIPAYKDYIKK